MLSHYPIRKKSNGVKSGDLANHEVQTSQSIQRSGNEVMRQSGVLSTSNRESHSVRLRIFVRRLLS